jgi:hypothetical protein
MFIPLGSDFPAGAGDLLCKSKILKGSDYKQFNRVVYKSNFLILSIPENTIF